MKHHTSLIIGLMFMSTWVQAISFEGGVHQEIPVTELEANQHAFERGFNILDLWEAMENLPLGHAATELSQASCQQHIDHIDDLLDSYFYSIQLQKLALDCHNLLDHENHAHTHEKHLLNLAQLVTASGDGQTLETAFWVTDLESAYEFLALTDTTIVDGELQLHNNQSYLAVLVQADDIFAEFRYFQLNQFFRGINRSVVAVMDQEEAHLFKVLNMVLKSELKNNEGLFVLAQAGISEAQILLAKLLLSKTKKFPTLYVDALSFFQQAADNDSVIAQYHYAYRIFIDKLEDQYTRGHEMITAALSARYLPALTLAAIVREQKLGIKKDKKTVAEIIALLDEQGQPGEYELLIGRQMLNDRIWNNHKLAKKYLIKAIEKNNPEAMILYGDMFGHGIAVKQNHKKAHKWYEKASLYDQSGEALIKIGINMLYGQGVKKNIKNATKTFVKAGEMGAELGHGFAGSLLYANQYNQVDHRQAHKYFLQGHGNQDPFATMLLAKSYFHGHGVQQNHKRAFELFTSIEDQGYYDVDMYLAAAYYHGLGTPKNSQKAVTIYRDVINNKNSIRHNRPNNVLANLNLRLSYMGEHQVLTPYDNLVSDLQRQVDSNDASARYKLGYLKYVKYTNGMNRETGIELLKQAAQSGVPQAHSILARYYRTIGNNANAQSHQEIALQMGDPEAIYYAANEVFDNTPEKAVEMMKKAAESGLIFAMNKLADIYYHNEAITPNPEQSLYYSQMAAAAGDHSALSDILKLYTEQKISKHQLADTVKQTEEAAEAMESTRLMRKLSEFYANEALPEFDPEMAIHWYIKAYEAGDKEAIIELGKRYMYGIQLQQNFDLAQFFFANAAAKSSFTWADLVDEPGSFWVALLLQKGLGVEQNLELARTLYANNFQSIRSKEAKNNYAVMTCQADNSEKKERKNAFELIKALSEKSRTALFNLGWMYEHGICTEPNLDAAKQAYQQSAQKQSPHALFRLHQLHQTGHIYEKNEQLAASYLQRSIDSSRKVKYHNMMSTFLDLPYIKNLMLVTQADSNAASQ